MPDAACASCGAALRPGADACDLCGTTARAADSPSAVPAGGSVRCPQCGHAPPPGSAFCNRCGTVLEDVNAVPAARPERPPSDVGRRAFTVAAIGLGLVVGLYALTVWSDRAGDTTAPVETPALGPAAAIPDGAPPLPDSLQIAADRFASKGTPSGWYESGRYYLTAAFESRETDPTASVRWTRRAIQDFERSLDLEENSDVRFALAEAATFDPSNPMRPVQELQAVLESDPDYVPALVMLGDMRRQIGRLDSARVSLERALELTEPGDPLRQRAEQVLASIPPSAPGEG